MPEPALLPAAPASAIPVIPPERRARRRQSLAALVYVELDEFTGGIINNLSEGGLEIRCAVPIFEREFSHVRFQLSDHGKWIAAPARVVWMRESNRLAGLAFVNPAPEVVAQIAVYLGLMSALSTIEIPGARIAVSEERDLAGIAAPSDGALSAADERTGAAAESDFACSSESHSSIDPVSLSEGAPPSAAVATAAPEIKSDSAIDVSLAVAAAAVGCTLPAKPESRQSLQPLQAPPAPLAQVIPISLAEPPKPQSALSKPVQLSRGWDRSLTILLGLFLFLVGWTARGVRDQSAQESRAAAETIPTQDLNNLQLPGDSAASSSANPSPGTTGPSADLRATPAGSSSTSSSAATQSVIPLAQSAREGSASDPARRERPRDLDIPRPTADSSSSDLSSRPSSADPVAKRTGSSSTSSTSSSSFTSSAFSSLPKRDPISLIANGHLVYRADNSAAANAMFSSAVTLRALIGPDGRVRSAQPIAGPQALAAAAIAAVHNWRFEILRPQGQPISSTCDVTVAVVAAKP